MRRPDPCEDLGRGSCLSTFGLLEAQVDRSVERLAFLLIEFVAFVIEHEIDGRTFGEHGRFVDDEATISDGGSDTHTNIVPQQLPTGKFGAPREHE